MLLGKIRDNRIYIPNLCYVEGIDPPSVSCRMCFVEIEIDRSHPFLDYYPNRCVLCGECVHVCREKNGQSALTFSKRGFDTVISFYGVTDLSTLECKNCNACIDICPVGALAIRNWQQVSIEV